MQIMKKQILENLSKIIEERIQILKEEGAEINMDAPSQETESIYDAKPGNTLIIDFENITIKLQRVHDDLFKVTDAAGSEVLKNNDYVKVEGNDILGKDKKMTFRIFREIQLKYESNAIQDWRIIKS